MMPRQSIAPTVASNGTSPTATALPLDKLPQVVGLSYLAFLAYVLVNLLDGYGTESVCALLVVTAAILPSWLWVKGKARGYPLFPAFLATFAYTFGFQFLTNREIRQTCQPGALWDAAWTIVFFLLLSTAVWSSMMKKVAPPISGRIFMISGQEVERKLFAVLFLFAAFTVGDTAGWLTFLGSTYSLFRSLFYSPGILSAFALCYIMGRGELALSMRGPVILAIAFAALAMAVSLLLVQAACLWILCVVAFVLGGGRIPWPSLVIGLCAFAILHNGKYTMREKYWAEDALTEGLKPWQYPGYFAEWFGYGVGSFGHEDANSVTRSSILERSSLLQMLLLIQDKSPDPIPFLKGKTYLGVPALLIPRLLVRNRTSPTENNAIMSIHYGLVDEEQSRSTSIGWGMLNESYANFGTLGVAGLAVLLGGFFGFVTRWTSGYPVTSFRGLFAVLVLSLCFQTEYSMGFFVSVLSQSSIALLIFSFLIMRVVEVSEAPPPEPVVTGYSRRPMRRRFAR